MNEYNAFLAACHGGRTMMNVRGVAMGRLVPAFGGSEAYNVVIFVGCHHAKPKYANDNGERL
jgi:hypothetical protein